MSVSQLAFAWDTARVAVESDQPADLRWLERFLCPWFTSSSLDAREQLPRIRMLHDEREHTRLTRAFEIADTTPTPCFALDTEVVVRPGFRMHDAHDAQVVADTTLGAFYVLREQVTEIVALPEDLRARFAAMRVIREQVRGQLAGSPWAALHAAAVEHRGRGALIVGPKQAGKTTLLAYLLSMAGAALVANDWSMLRCDDAARVTLHGMPTVVRVRPGSAQLVAALARALEPAESSFLIDAQHDAGACAQYAVTPARPGERHQRMGDFAAALGAQSTPRAELSAILFPRQATDETRAAAPLIAPLTRTQARERLDAARYGLGAGAHAPTLFGGAATLPAASVLDALAERVPAFEVCVPAAAFSEATAAHALVDLIASTARASR